MEMSLLSVAAFCMSQGGSRLWPVASPTWCGCPAAKVLHSGISSDPHVASGPCTCLFLCRRWLGGKGNWVPVHTYMVAFILELNWITYGRIYSLIFSFESSQLVFRAEIEHCSQAMLCCAHLKQLLFPPKGSCSSAERWQVSQLKNNCVNVSWLVV